jgi:outer membrane protein
MKSLNKNILALAVAAVVNGYVAAYEAGDFIVRAGYAAVDPRDSSDDLKVNGAKLDGTGVGVDGAAAVGITASYMITPHWGIEVLASTPFKHDITTKGLGGLGVADGTRLGSAKHLPPTVSAQYYFLESNSSWQPYAGIGINYTTFFSEDLTNDAQAALGADNLKLKDSIGLAGEIGLDWRVDERWLINASVWRAQIKSDASLNTALGKVKTEVTINPWVYMLAVGYKF